MFVCLDCSSRAYLTGWKPSDLVSIIIRDVLINDIDMYWLGNGCNKLAAGRLPYTGGECMHKGESHWPPQYCLMTYLHFGSAALLSKWWSTDMISLYVIIGVLCRCINLQREVDNNIPRCGIWSHFLSAASNEWTETCKLFGIKVIWGNIHVVFQHSSQTFRIS